MADGNPAPPSNDEAPELAALTSVLAVFQRLAPEARERLLQTIATFFGISTSLIPAQSSRSIPPHVTPSAAGPSFSEDRSISPKEFMWQKAPRTDVERVACLAYYLTHYRDMPQFRTLDVSKLNTEAAQPKFSNTAVSSNNAVKMGYLVPASKGTRQLSAMGEQFVRALPDREAAKEALAAARPRRRPRKANSAKQGQVGVSGAE